MSFGDELTDESKDLFLHFGILINCSIYQVHILLLLFLLLTNLLAKLVKKSQLFSDFVGG